MTVAKSKWTMNRAGLLNFWYYDDEIFQFSDGKLLLRGTNGSGKSVTMQSFLPVLLDGKKTPDRLDPFGSKARRMEDYLLGEKEVADRDERTGYLFMEYKKKGSNQYVTTGIGMQAKRNKGIKTWYFLLTDNRRIAYDFQLAHNHAGEKVPLSAKELENRIGQGGYVVHTQKEYMELVNKYIFGFQSGEAFEDLIKLLIQLRSPKLSKDFKPTVIYEILESALPPLTDDELRHLSDTIESMDQTAQQLEQLEREYESGKKLVKQYDLYNQYILAERAKQWETALKRYGEAKGVVQTLITEEREREGQIEQLQTKLHQHKQQKAVAETEKEQLQEHEVWKLEQTKAKKQEASEALTKEINTLQNQWDSKRKALFHHQQQLESLQLEHHQLTVQMKNLVENLQMEAEEAAFSQHEVNAQDFKRHQDQEFDFSIWRQESEDHRQSLIALRRLAEQQSRLEEEHGRLQAQSSEKKKEMDRLRKEKDDLNQWFTEQKQKLEHEVYSWIENNPMLAFSQERIQQIARLLQGLYESNRYDEVRESLLSAVHDYEAAVKAEKTLKEKERDDKKQQIKETKAELHSWQTLKMPNPNLTEETKVFREKLRHENQDFIPFYAAVEFKNHVTDSQRERLEAALKQTGLLDSLITAQPVSPVHDRVIQAKPEILGHTLADYLRPDLDAETAVSKQLVDEVLRSVSLEPSSGGIYVDLDGTYSIGCLVGHAPPEGTSKYIGRSSRKRFQQEKIAECEHELHRLQSELETINAQLFEYEENLQKIIGRKKSIPSDKELNELHIQIEKTDIRLEQQAEALNHLDKQWKIVIEKFQQVKVQLHQQGSQFSLTLKEDSITEALNALKDYEHHVYLLEKAYQKNRFCQEKNQSLTFQAQEKEEEMDQIRGEENSKADQLDRMKAEIEAIDQQLKLKGIDEVRNRIQQVQKILKETDEAIQHIQEELPKQSVYYDRCKEQLTEAKTNADFWLHMHETWESLVKEEISRGFVSVAKEEPSAIVESLQAVIEKYERAKLNEQLTKTFFNEQLHLTEYRMFEYTEEANRPGWFSKEWGAYYEPFINEWQQFQSRRLIQMEYHGQRVNPYYVLTSLEQELIEQKGYLDEQDRKLYEDIIVNSVGSILRTRIQRAGKWIREMNKIMESRDNSSGLTFSIAWKPLTAESEQELDTKDLVALLQRNSKFLTEEDLSRITQHFQSRIERAKELIQLRNEGSTLHQVLKEVLDYRKWFSFVLSFKRVNEPKRELTNNAFFKFSGGEKAMAMYIPLFTAAYSRYKEAADMAPYIISLDEAFAGVDENNIRDMFEVVEQLNFDYIMNSQALWGDYDTVSGLSICELVRPKNADFVTVIRYEWDGKQRKLVLEEKPTEGIPVNE